MQHIRLKRLLLLALTSCLALALLRALVLRGRSGTLLSALSISTYLAGGDCQSLRSLGDLADWVGRDNETAVCRDAEAIPLYREVAAGGGYPLCRLARPPHWLELRLRAGSVRTWADGGMATGAGVRRVPVFGHPEGDLISDQLVSTHSWEGKLVRPLLARLLRLGQGNVTLLDIGCNIGVYALQAAALGFPVVAVDANARNLLRVGLALREPTLAAAEARVELVWNFVSAATRLVRLNYPGDCNIGGATRFSRDVTDPVAVMPIGGGALANLVRTRLVLIKLDAEGGEADFLRTGGRLFDNLTVAAVQMEWVSRHHTGTDAEDIVRFFDCRRYSLHSVDGTRKLSIRRPESWPTDVLWLHKDYSWLLEVQ